MKKLSKTYQSMTYTQLDTYVLAGGIKQLIMFRGGTLEPPRNGIYTTNDPAVIEAMDKPENGLGRSYILLSEQYADDGVPAAGGEVKQPFPAASGDKYQEVPGITSVAKAREFLIKASEEGVIREGITASLLKNRVQVLSVAEECKIKFTDLPKE